MDWMLKTDGSQYKWVTAKYGWGLGYLTLNGKTEEWQTPVKNSKDLSSITYSASDIQISVVRKKTSDGFTEKYTFTNKGKNQIQLTNIGIYTPFNDNYPDANICMTNRCNAHIWTGENAAYVALVRMDGTGDGIGLMVTDGRISDYDVWERGMQKSYSNFRGVIALCPNDTILAPGKSTGVSWKVFHHSGISDFYQKLLAYGGAVVNSEKYVYEVRETAKVHLKTKGAVIEKEVKITQPGEKKVYISYEKNKSTYATLWGVNSYENLIQKRVNFILNNQQLHDANDPRDGAFMIYDNKLNAIYKNDTNRRSVDTDEGRERVGMGILLAKWYQLHPDVRIKNALIKYASFVRHHLQTEGYTTYFSMLKKNQERGYNYPWIADFYFRMYDITGDKQYAINGYQTMRIFFKHFGYAFYAINIPVIESIKVLEKANMKNEKDTLMNDYKLKAEKYIATGLNFPHHEVNYEQSIVAPAAQFMLEMYLTFKNIKYLEDVELFMKPLEAFAAQQPSYHLNEIAIRHWDGYWFGKHQMFGDVFPHYWSALNANCYYYYAKSTGNKSYMQRAENVVRNNLCLFNEEGRGSCAYLYPRHVNGEKAQYYDDFANDQDWALVYYLLINSNI